MSDAGAESGMEIREESSPAKSKRAVIATVPSDSHMWNMVYIELLLKEHGWEVINLGACTPPDLVVDTCLAERPDMLVISSVNGHGHIGGRKIIGAVRSQSELDYLPAVIGGKLGTLGANNKVFAEPLVEAGYSAVFLENDGVAPFTEFIEAPKRAELVA
jgi:methylmalonyl-CoA mutase cobalamin-binding subunit